MQAKIVIGTVAFMLTMIILGLAALLEPARMAEVSEARVARQIEDGAALFDGNCATCHGLDGKAEQCFDANGNPQGCVGRPLNHVPLVCGDKSQRMDELGWAGSKRNLIFQTISAGRLGTLMPTWSQEFGGPMEPYQIEQLTNYILNWGEDPALCGEGAPTPVAVEWPESAEELPEGNAENGQALYETTYGCAGCHGDPTRPGSNPVGPWLGNIGNDAATRVEGASAAQYIYQSILDPNAFIAPTCANDQPCGSPSGMPATFGSSMSQQDMADIIAYYLTLKQ